MIPAPVVDRLTAVILGSTRARGFALVLFYDDDGQSEEHNCADALVSQADPTTAATLLTKISDQFYHEVAQGVRAL